MYGVTHKVVSNDGLGTFLINHPFQQSYACKFSCNVTVFIPCKQNFETHFRIFALHSKSTNRLVFTSQHLLLSAI